MLIKKQNMPNVIRSIGIVVVILASGCASYPSQPPTCSGEYYPVNPEHMERGDSPKMRREPSNGIERNLRISAATEESNDKDGKNNGA